jgi:hypothetical protein
MQVADMERQLRARVQMVADAYQRELGALQAQLDQIDAVVSSSRPPSPPAALAATQPGALKVRTVEEVRLQSIKESLYCCSSRVRPSVNECSCCDPQKCWFRSIDRLAGWET